MSDRPECGGHEPPAAEDSCDDDGCRDTQYRVSGLRCEPVTAGGETGGREQDERRYTDQARDQQREYRDRTLD
jgi:hypothetical protein